MMLMLAVSRKPEPKRAWYEAPGVTKTIMMQDKKGVAGFPPPPGHVGNGKSEREGPRAGKSAKAHLSTRASPPCERCSDAEEQLLGGPAFARLLLQ